MVRFCENATGEAKAKTRVRKVRQETTRVEQQVERRLKTQEMEARKAQKELTGVNKRQLDKMSAENREGLAYKH
jgi:hypothetical protein